MMFFEPEKRDRDGLALIYGHDSEQLRTLRAAPEAFA